MLGVRVGVSIEKSKISPLGVCLLFDVVVEVWSMWTVAVTLAAKASSHLVSPVVCFADSICFSLFLLALLLLVVLPWICPLIFC